MNQDAQYKHDSFRLYSHRKQQEAQVVALIEDMTAQAKAQGARVARRETMAHMLRCFVADWARIIKYVVVTPDGRVVACCERPTQTQSDWDFSTAFYTDEIDMAPYLPTDMWQESLIQLES